MYFLNSECVFIFLLIMGFCNSFFALFSCFKYPTPNPTVFFLILHNIYQDDLTFDLVHMCLSVNSVVGQSESPVSTFVAM